ncbi:flagellar hook capping FlgD N-terminal domain-containing protein [Saccharibacillus sacchari]|uniref:Basal-body rod modification protein FlgD n=1 Tax=Saccharibacillus sacchari DSM 19268 TaxID=915437 RepID=A0A011AMC6_9BACL|nr:flagellar hook capping FlgD N-terminal domain-containing protein [Saccharibacillus sacchari]EXG83131.1 flagellar hook capping protein [Saccharibacillus sacchari DSM 19268]
MANSNVSTTNIWPNYSTQNVQKAAAKKTDDAATMGKDQFMTILIAQLKNQDPLAPMDNSQFTAQMAQFSSLEQLMNMSTQLTQMNSSMGTASQLIGQKITWYDSETANYLTGNVASVLQKDGKMYAAVGEYLVPTSDITMVEPAGTSETPTAGTAPAADTTTETPKSETNTDAAAQQAQASGTQTSQSSTEEAAGTSESGNDGGVK